MGNGRSGGFRRDDYSESSGGPPPPPNNYDEWYYVERGEKQGPISAIAIKTFLNSGEIADDTYVWRRGMKDWCTIRESELYGFVDNIVPAISSHMVGNGFVWVIAFLPIIFSMIDASINSYNREQAAGFWSLGITPHLISANLTWKLYAPVNGFFALLDFIRLKKAGYGTLWRGLLAFFIPVVYLFLRARLLKQRPSYAIVWLAMFVSGLLID